MKTIFLLMSQYGAPLVLMDTVRKDYFPHIESNAHFTRKIYRGEINLTPIKPDKSNKSSVFISLDDLAKYLDARIAEGIKEKSLISHAN